MKFVLQTADAAGDARNCFYPNRVEVGCAEDLQEAVKKDHVCGSYRKDYRSVGNFLGSDVLVMDCDNDHTENQGEWITAEKLDELMPDLCYAIAFSRNHMKVKDGRKARPKFHVVYAQQNDELLNASARLTAEKDAIIAKISGGSKQKEALEDILHYTSGASMITEFDEDLFTRFVDRVIVYSRTEIGFDMKCGPIFRERI